jgi:hypothetical protein
MLFSSHPRGSGDGAGSNLCPGCFYAQGTALTQLPSRDPENRTAPAVSFINRLLTSQPQIRNTIQNSSAIAYPTKPTKVLFSLLSKTSSGNLSSS